MLSDLIFDILNQFIWQFFFVEIFVAYSKMLIDLGALVDYHDFFWNSKKIDDVRRVSDILTV